MAAYCFLDMYEIIDPDKLEKYRSGVLATVKQFGGRYLLIGGMCDTIEGQWRPTFPVLIEFPSLDYANKWYNSQEYSELKALRLAATKCNTVFTEGDPNKFLTSYK